VSKDLLSCFNSITFDFDHDNITPEEYEAQLEELFKTYRQQIEVPVEVEVPAIA